MYVLKVAQEVIYAKTMCFSKRKYSFVIALSCIARHQYRLRKAEGIASSAHSFNVREQSAKTKSEIFLNMYRCSFGAILFKSNFTSALMLSSR